MPNWKSIWAGCQLVAASSFGQENKQSSVSSNSLTVGLLDCTSSCGHFSCVSVRCSQTKRLQQHATQEELQKGQHLPHPRVSPLVSFCSHIFFSSAVCSVGTLCGLQEDLNTFMAALKHWFKSKLCLPGEL